MFFALLTALGLSGAAGLNAYIPLFLVGILARAGVISLAAPYDALASLPILIFLGVLLVVEIIVDKIPGIDHINDIIQTFIRPAAGALLLASAAEIIKGLDPRIAMAIGLLTALSVHGVKAGARPIINVTTFGLGASVISVIEDLISLCATVVALLVPPLVLVFVALLALVIGRLFKRWRTHRPARPGTVNRAIRRRKRPTETRPSGSV